MDSQSAPFIITQPEFMRRMKEMNQSGGGGMFGWETCLTCTT
jgi:molecular chaperone HtpG